MGRNAVSSSRATRDAQIDLPRRSDSGAGPRLMESCAAYRRHPARIDEFDKRDIVRHPLGNTSSRRSTNIRNEHFKPKSRNKLWIVI